MGQNQITWEYSDQIYNAENELFGKSSFAKFCDRYDQSTLPTILIEKLATKGLNLDLKRGYQYFIENVY